MFKKIFYSLVFFSITIFCFLIPSTSLQAQYYVPPDSEGATDVTMYKADTVVIDSIITNDVVLMPHDLMELGKTASAGIASHYSDYTKIYSIPLSYILWSKLKFELSIPYVYREIKNSWTSTTSKADGLGDIKAGASYLHSFSDVFDSITSIAVTFPTGDAEKTDNAMLVPLGSGSRSYSITQSFSYLPLEKLRLYASALGIVYENTEINSNKVDRGNVYGILLGCEYTLDSIKGFIKINYININETTIKDSWGFSFGLNDSLKTSDVIVGALFRIYSVIALNASVSIPAYTKYDNDLTDTPDRKWYANFSVTSFL
ncbi:MAG: hypothetical protein N3F66_06035 [Spirochaetes bacterium]|nr:hypothetical protein [Spirochaetota bacterium]